MCGFFQETKKNVTQSICHRLKLNTENILTGTDLQNINDDEILQKVEYTEVFVELTPEQKSLVVEILQQNGHTVGFLGDGLNDINAITLDGELINIDGRGNRVCYLIYGPAEVVVIVGMNKVVPNVDDGIRRIRNEATPPNCNRLGCKTPCAETGRCGDCLTNTICCEIVVTRKSLAKDRIKVILIGETLGY